MPYCYLCYRDFNSRLGLTEHYVQSPDHHYCKYCRIHLDSASQIQNHNEAEHAYCRLCERHFKSNIGLHEHNRQKHASVYCVPCRRQFLSPSNCQSHLNSSLHRAEDTFCPSSGCSIAFINQSALMLHFESGSCQSDINRRVIYEWVRDNDRSNVTTNPARLSQRGGFPPIATDRSWNGQAYECRLCRFQYRSLASLNCHLASRRHQKKVYRCPSCHAHFVSLSGFCQHTESGQCNVLDYKEAIDEVLAGVTRLAL
ncbi:hypothetical protein K503DRAFT_769706 [Rhizopogon vinicolor AM-OR11-026]|uniref:C2H2-type domain-containing protein n=1 Tax=Rhizopogon vinicolor AM-OR11-026 TaxID=1314800 RepID=A0A1B7N2Y6_9AGAM|nr:hypothetical protein K503DRAFT_769706 [Rhizopogon vinicolor AM-OR11-026]